MRISTLEDTYSNIFKHSNYYTDISNSHQPNEDSDSIVGANRE